MEVKHCVVLHDIVAVLERKHVGDRLHVSSTSLNSWTVTSLSYNGMSLATYQSKFVVVGGCLPSTHNEVTDQLLTSTTGKDWQSSLPPMPTKRFDASAVSAPSSDVLVVAGGRDSDSRHLNVVEVLLGNQWNTTYPLPFPLCFGMRSTFHDNNFYFTGLMTGENVIYTCSCASLITSCQTSNESTTSQAWMKISKLTDTSVIVSYSSRLIGISMSGTMRVYSDVTKSWVGTTSVGYREDISHLAAAVLPTEGFVIAYKHGVYRVKISGECECANMVLILATSLAHY